ncbi:MAG TPA: DUF552 domain-containing protein [Candidatus Bathyarchaeota archaeon]|nr:DUF552 domain-containing protein [Candidatus Bathyarchaeota archaeon]
MSGLLDRLVKKNEEDRPRDVQYIKAIPLRAYEDIDVIKAEVRAGNVVICNVSPLAKTNIEDVKRGINELNTYANAIEGDIARLGEERVIITPKNIRIWRNQPRT